MIILRTGAVLLLFSVGIGCGLGKYVSLRHNITASNSMSPTIEPGDHYASMGIKNNDLDPLQRLDIVVYKHPPVPERRIDENTRFTHRIVGLSGEKVEIKEGVIFINDVQLDESSFQKLPSKDTHKAVVVPPNEYFLLGDNRNYSEDSRYVGTVKREDIDGKVTTIIRKTDYDNGKRW